MISIKHGHCLLIHGSSVFFAYILDTPLPRLVKYVQKTQTYHVSKGSDHILYTCPASPGCDKCPATTDAAEGF